MNDASKCPSLNKEFSLPWAMTNQLKKFFSICDSKHANSVDRETFHVLCNRLSISACDADLIFEDLDHDQDGRISFADFSRGFSEFLSTTNSRESELDFGTDDENEENIIKSQAWTTLTNEAERVGKSNREKHDHEMHLKRMEEELDNQVKDVEIRMNFKAQAEVEDERKSLQSKMNTEMDNLQAHLVLFEKVNSWLQSHPLETHDVILDEVRSKLDEAVHENRHLRMSLLDTQTNIALVRSELLQLRTLYEEKCRELSSEREKILEVLHDQNHLSRQLNLLHDANKRLQDTNDSLRDSLEVNPFSLKQSTCGVQYHSKSGSIVGDYIEHGLNLKSTCRYKTVSDDESTCKKEEREISCGESSLEPTYSMDIDFHSRRRADIFPDSRILNQSDSGVSTAKDSQEVDNYSNVTVKSIQSNQHCEERTYLDRHNLQPTPLTIVKDIPTQRLSKEENQTSVSAVEERARKNQTLKVEELPKRKICDIIKQLGIEETPESWNRNRFTRRKSIDYCIREARNGSSYSERKYFAAPVPLPRMNKKQNTVPAELEDWKRLEYKQNAPVTDELCFTMNNLHNAKCVTLDRTPDNDETVYETDGQAIETFKVVFIGDAGVGKSSFALRISKGVFVGQMSSTLGVDFLMRTLGVDGRSYAIQLWDTAGQERFRSITKSYFRKADGVLLLYDCICEQSFLNVRQWVEDLDSVTSKRIPLMIVANKVDLRPAMMASGRFYVTTLEGEKLAKDCGNTTFMEASAKDGSNVIHCLANLIRSMINHQDQQKSTSVMNLCDEKIKKSSSCCAK